MLELCTSGAQAVEQAKQMQLDLILMDIQMPGMDGIRACELIHQLPHQQQTPVIAVTAHAMAGQKEKLLSAGMNDYLAKPIDEEKLHSLLLRYKPGHIGGTYTVSSEQAEISVNQNATFDWPLALRQAANKPDLARDMLQMLVAFLPEIRNKVEEQQGGRATARWRRMTDDGLREMIHKLHGSCGYSGVPRLKNLCQLLEQQLRAGTPESELEPEFLELLDEMDNVTREARRRCWAWRSEGSALGVVRWALTPALSRTRERGLMVQGFGFRAVPLDRAGQVPSPAGRGLG